MSTVSVNKARTGTFPGINPQALEQWRAHAMDCVPDSDGNLPEKVGFLLEDGSFVPMDNSDPDPNNHFSVSYKDIEQYRPVAILHSHTPGPQKTENGVLVTPTMYPSRMDMAAQIETGLTFGLSTADRDHCSDPVFWGDAVPIAPLIGRTFIHGVHDCFSLARDWHWLEHGIYVDDYPREDNWWDPRDGSPPEDLYEQHFESQGFVRVNRTSPLPGDVFICRVATRKARNHCGVYLGGGLILHQLAFALSMRTPAHRWHDRFDFLLRHKNLPELEDV